MRSDVTSVYIRVIYHMPSCHVWESEGNCMVHSITISKMQACGS